MSAIRTDVSPWSEAITLGDSLLRAAAEHPDADGVVFPEERLSFRQLADRAEEIARGLMSLGAKRGDRIGLLMANSPDCIATQFAIFMTGASAVPINIRYRARELPHVISDGDVSIILTSNRINHYVDLFGLLCQALPGLGEAPDHMTLSLDSAPGLKSVIVLGNHLGESTKDSIALAQLAELISAEQFDLRRRSIRLADEAILLYTSGTTSLPRGCPLSHEALLRTWTSLGEILDVRAGDRFWAPCPLFHLAAIGPMILTVSRRAAFLSDTFFQADRGLALICDEHATHLYPAYPPITTALMDLPTFTAADLSAARVMVNVGPPEMLAQMQATAPTINQLTQYGLTEAGGPVTYNTLSDDLTVRVHTTGLPLPGTSVRILDPDSGENQPADASGEILFRSPGMTQGYINDPVKSAEIFDADGWCHTGDRGALDTEGRLIYLGRLKDMLKVGGENVAPAEVEDHLMTHPAVKMAVVVGVPDARLEEVPAAFIELRDGGLATEEELMVHCQTSMARFKVPRYLRFVNDWPLSATKVQKGPLRERLMAELAEVGAH